MVGSPSPILSLTSACDASPDRDASLTHVWDDGVFSRASATCGNSQDSKNSSLE